MLERIDHVNLVVADMQAMIAFYRDILGMRLSRQVTISGPWIDDVTDLADVTADVAFMEAPDGPTIEMIHYRRPQGMRAEGQSIPNTFGLRHVAFCVSDIDQVAAAVRSAGLTLLSEIHRVPTAQVAFSQTQKRLVYFRDPEGNLMELCAYE
jgi:catechol 2,3-dioxygenase-like lactoylglutathione lyase family enzyme